MVANAYFDRLLSDLAHDQRRADRIRAAENAVKDRETDRRVAEILRPQAAITELLDGKR